MYSSLTAGIFLAVLVGSKYAFQTSILVQKIWLPPTWPFELLPEWQNIKHDCNHK